MALERNYVEIEGQKWAYLRYGDKNKRKIILLHGILNYADYFHSMATILEDDFEIIVPDLPGFGFTTAVLDNSPKTISERLELFCGKLGIRKAAFFGMSLGGLVALDLALKNPSLVENLIIQSSPWRNRGIHPGPIEKTELFLLILPNKILELFLKPPIFSQILKLLSLVDKDLKDILKIYQNIVIEGASLIDISALKKLWASMSGVDLSKDVSNLKSKALLIVGEKDPIVPMKETLDLAKKIKHDLVVIIKNEGHLVTYDATEKVSQIVKYYLKWDQKYKDEGIKWLKI
jgi:pimeloyl-ACP methyl ester carboxylesterase